MHRDLRGAGPILPGRAAGGRDRGPPRTIGPVSRRRAPPSATGRPSAATEEDVVDTFVGWVEGRGLTLYPAQEEALLEMAPAPT